MAKMHIGKKIKEVLDKTGMSKTEFAKKINLTRDGAYKLFEKEAIATGQLEKISKVLNHDFFQYYQNGTSGVNDKQNNYGFASKEDMEELTKIVTVLAKEIEKMRKEMAQMAPQKQKKKKK